MKKIFFVVFSMFVVFFGVAYGDDACYYVDDDNKITDTEIINKWGMPTIGSNILESTNDAGCFPIVSKKRSCSSLSAEAWAKLAMVAHDVSLHGAYFCLTNILAIKGDKYKVGFNSPYSWEYQCAWFCEPGWDGVRCEEPSSPSSVCNSVDYNEMYNFLAGDKKDEITFGCQTDRTCVGDKVKVFDVGYPLTSYQQMVVLGARRFDSHGIVAQPMVISVSGDASFYFVPVEPATSGIKKTLCAQGYTKDGYCNMSSGNCTNGNANIDWCYYYRTDTTWGKLVAASFNPDIHMKVPGSECDDSARVGGKCPAGAAKHPCYNIECKNGFSMGADRQCKACPYKIKSGYCDVSSNTENYGKCISCDDGQYFNKETCNCDTVEHVVKLSDMQYGPSNSGCWMLDDTAEYKKCVIGSN